ncbi:hypothetical protein SAY87_029052 [Trapa incisa]|uniref:Uncharacterized protein n=1 Tax=Trapa incisa TaxID=236973 RepID=A0AAN7QS83_9MYRT|nr:hypothetical protein SAY87_029052 [Trapa incisa]
MGERGIMIRTWEDESEKPYKKQLTHLLEELERGSPICPSPGPNPVTEVNMFRANMMTESGMASAGGMSSHGLELGLDPLSPLPTIGLRTHHSDQANHQTLRNGHLMGEAQNDHAIQTLYQRLKFSTGDYESERSLAAATSGISMAAAPTPSSLVFESAPMSGLGGGGGADQLGHWSNNPNLCWRKTPAADFNVARQSGSAPELRINIRNKLQCCSTKQGCPPELGDSNGFYIGSWFSMEGSCLGAATWSEEKLLLWEWWDCEGNELQSNGSRAGEELVNDAIQVSETWGLVLVTASLDGKIRTFHNYGLPMRL